MIIHGVQRLSAGREPIIGDRYWVGASSTNWSDAGNWSENSGGVGGASVPQNDTNVYFDGSYTLNANCTCDIPINTANLFVESAYDGILDFGDSGFLHDLYGNATFAGSGTVDCGISTINLNGSFTNQNQATWIAGTATWVATGKNATWEMSTWGRRVYNLSVEGSYTNLLSATLGRDFVLAEGAKFTLNNNFIVSNAATIDGYVDGPGELRFNASSTISATAEIVCGILGTTQGTMNVATGAKINPTAGTNNSNSNFVIAGTPVSIGGTWTFNSGSSARSLFFRTDLTFTGPVVFASPNAGALNVGNNDSNPNLFFQSDVSITPTTGAINWVKGTGSFNLTGTANQSLALNGEAVEDFVLEKSAGIATLTNGVTVDGLTGTNGNLDINGQTLTIAATGNFTSAPGCVFADTPNTGLIVVGGNFALNGASDSLVNWNGPNLNIAGTATANFAVVTDSDASAGTPVTATNSLDNGGNVGWNFT